VMGFYRTRPRNACRKTGPRREYFLRIRLVGTICARCRDARPGVLGIFTMSKSNSAESAPEIPAREEQQLRNTCRRFVARFADARCRIPASRPKNTGLRRLLREIGDAISIAHFIRPRWAACLVRLIPIFNWWIGIASPVSIDRRSNGYCISVSFSYNSRALGCLL
jgi:hypothetical protein